MVERLVEFRRLFDVHHCRTAPAKFYFAANGEQPGQRTESAINAAVSNGTPLDVGAAATLDGGAMITNASTIDP